MRRVRVRVRVLILVPLLALSACEGFLPSNNPLVETRCDYQTSLATVGMQGFFAGAWAKEELMAKCRKMNNAN